MKPGLRLLVGPCCMVAIARSGGSDSEVPDGSDASGSEAAGPASTVQADSSATCLALAAMIHLDPLKQAFQIAIQTYKKASVLNSEPRPF